MNNEKFEKSINALKANRLSEEEKNQMFQNIRFAVRERAEQPKRFFSFKSFFVNKYAVTTFILLAVVASSAGVSKAAQGSLPGDLLYPIKTQVNEKIQTVLAVTPEKKAKIESKITTVRLQEAEALTKQGKLDDKKKAAIVESVAEHSVKAQINIQAVKSKETELEDVEEDSKPAVQLDNQLDDSLQKHIEVLTRLSEEKSSGEKRNNHSAEVLKALTERAKKRVERIEQKKNSKDIQNKSDSNDSGKRNRR